MGSMASRNNVKVLSSNAEYTAGAYGCENA